MISSGVLREVPHSRREEAEHGEAERGEQHEDQLQRDRTRVSLQLQQVSSTGAAAVSHALAWTPEPTSTDSRFEFRGERKTSPCCEGAPRVRHTAVLNGRAVRRDEPTDDQL